MSNLSQIDLQPISDQMGNIMIRLQNAFKRMETGFIREVLGFNRMSEQDIIKYFDLDLNKEERENIENIIDEEVGEQTFENLPENVQNAIKLYMSQIENNELDKYDKRDILTGDIETIEAMLRDKNIVPYTNDEGDIDYRLRQEEDDKTMENIKNFFNNLFKGQEAKAGTLDQSLKDVEKLNKQRNLVSNDAASNTIIYRRKSRRNMQRNATKREETQLSSASVNSNDKIISDLLITKIKY